MDTPRTPAPSRPIPSGARPAAGSRERIREQLGWRLCPPQRA